ncbi:MAG TPA: hypothetical protein VJX16_25230 [Terriglobales bacterium]|nr:hypothetical protein [Terriglobales bacterium]
MKKQLFTLAAVVALLLTVGSAYAQIGSDRMLVANVPFDFSVGTALLPAGQYTVQSIGTSNKTLLIRGSLPKASVIVLTIDTQASKEAAQSQLVFHRYGSQYFLSRVAVKGCTRGHELGRSKREVEMARNDTAQELVLVAQAH